MKKQITILFLVLISYVGIAQNITVKHGQQSPIESRTTSQFIYSDGSNVYQFKFDYKNNNGYVHKISIKTLSEVGKELVIGKDLGDIDVSSIQIHNIKDLLYIFWTRYDKSKKINEINCRVINKNLKTIGKDVVVSSFEAKNARQANIRGDYSVYFSNDSTEILISNTENLKDKKSFDYIFTIFNLKLNQLSKSKFSIEVKDDNFDLQDILFSNSGKIFLITSRYLESKEREKGESRKLMTCYTIDSQNGKTKEFDFDVPNKYINSVQAFIDKDDNLKCVGVYSDLSKRGKSDWGIQGVFYKKINSKDLTTEKETTNEFDSKLIALISGNKAAKKDRGALDYELKGVLEKPNGGIYVLLEEQWTYTVTTTTTNSNGSTSTRTTTYYCAGDVTAISYSATGKVEWFSNTTKNQEFRENPYARHHSFYYDVQKENLVLAYYYIGENKEKDSEINIEVVTFASNSGKKTVTPLMMSEGLEEGVVPYRGTAQQLIKGNESTIICETMSGKKPKCCCMFFTLFSNKSKTNRYSAISLR